MKLVLLPGWNESGGDLRLFVEGRHRIPGLAAMGFDCRIFDDGKGSLRERIDQFGDFLTKLRSEDGTARVGTLGYSAGGLVTRGFLRAFPERSGEIAGTFQLGVPNAGVVTDDLASLLRTVSVSADVIEDLDIESEFFQWLNGTSGHWEQQGGSAKYWRLNAAPWVAPPGARITNLVGRMPRYENRSDGIVLVESATLNDHLEHDFIDGRQANHLNLAGLWNPFTLVFRGWRGNDEHWPGVVEAVGRFFGEMPAAPG